MKSDNSLLKVFKKRYSDEVEYLLPVDSADFDYSTFDGQSRAASWKPIRMKHVREGSRGERWIPGDFPAGSMGDLILNGRAKREIGSLLETYGELLPLICDEEYWTLNVTCIIDALDEPKSDVVCSSEPGRLLMIHKHVFRLDALNNAVVFKLPQWRRGPVFFTTPFVELIKQSGLTGLVFKQIWAPN